MPRFRSKRGRAVGIAFGAERLFLRAGDGRSLTVPLPENLLSASSSELNFSSTADAARVLGDALERLASSGGEAAGGAPTEAVLAIPDRAVAVGLAEPAAAGGRKRLLTSLAASLAVGADSGVRPGIRPGIRPGARPALDRVRFGTIPSGSFRRRSLLGACASAAVVSQYEAVAAAVGLKVRWVDTPTLAILPEWLAAGASGGERVGERVLVALHRRHFAVAAASGNRLTAFRLKLRAALDPEPPAAAARRLGATGADDALSIRGDGAAEVRALLGLPEGSPTGAPEPGTRRGRGVPGEASPPTPPSEAAPPIWEEALAALLRRVGVRPSPLLASRSPAAAAG